MNCVLSQQIRSPGVNLVASAFKRKLHSIHAAGSIDDAASRAVIC